MRRPIVYGGLLAVVACGGGSGNPNLSVAPGTCPGSQYAVVTNNWTGPVDIFAVMAGSSDRRALGTIQPGLRLEVAVPPGTTEIMALQEGRTEPNAVSRNLRQVVNVRYECR